MTNSKLRNSDSACSICFSKVLLKSFTFLINTADKEIYNIINSFLFLYYYKSHEATQLLSLKYYTGQQRFSMIHSTVL